MKTAVALFVLAVAGQACALFAVDVQPFAVYEHYRLLSWLLAGQSPAAWGILVQAVVVGTVAFRRRATLLRIAGRVVSVRALLLVALPAAFSLAVPTISVSRFAGE